MNTQRNNAFSARIEEVFIFGYDFTWIYKIDSQLSNILFSYTFSNNRASIFLLKFQKRQLI